MDTLMNQIVEMKKTIQEKDRLLAEKDKQIEDLSKPPVINIKSGNRSKKANKTSESNPPQDTYTLTESVNDF